MGEAGRTGLLMTLLEVGFAMEDLRLGSDVAALGVKDTFSLG